jgi:GT2 family glycosyltransferase
VRELLTSIETYTENMPHAVVIYENNDGGWVPAIHNAIAGLTGYCVLLGSDVVVEADWLRVLWAAFIDAFPSGDGVAEPYNEIHGAQLCQHPLAHTDTIKKYLYRGYTHWYSDNDFTDQARRDGKLIYVPDARVEHRHAAIGKAEWDSTYETVYNRDTNERDRLIYEQRRANGYTDIL